MGTNNINVVTSSHARESTSIPPNTHESEIKPHKGICWGEMEENKAEDDAEPPAPPERLSAPVLGVRLC